MDLFSTGFYFNSIHKLAGRVSSCEFRASPSAFLDNILITLVHLLATGFANTGNEVR